MIILITGGIKSGKSSFALQKAEAMQEKNDLYFLATAVDMDREIQERIKIHKKSRGPSWNTIEEPIDLKKAFSLVPDKSTVLLDCLTLWLGNILHDQEKILFSDIEKNMKNILSLINKKKLNVIFVTNEVGWGIIPENELGRIYQDLLGKLNQLIAESADEVHLMVSGINIKIKGV